VVEVRSEIKWMQKVKVKLSLYRPWTNLQGYRRLRPPEFIATRYIKVGSGCKRVNFNLNVYVLLVTGLYIVNNCGTD
jgi:hypothetical protein